MGAQYREAPVLNTVTGAQYRGGVQYRGGYREYRGGGGGYHEYHGGCSIPWEDTIFCYLNTPTGLNTLHSTHDIPHMHHDMPPWY